MAIGDATSRAKKLQPASTGRAGAAVSAKDIGYTAPAFLPECFVFEEPVEAQ